MSVKVKRETWIKRIRTYFEQEDLPSSGPPRRRNVSKRGNKALIGHRNGSYREAKKYYNAIANDYLEMVFDSTFESGIIAAIAEKIEERKPATVLDAGCGIGISLGFYASAFQEISFCGSDISDKMLALATARMHKNSIRNVRFVTCYHDELGEHISFNSVDMIIAVNTMPSPLFSEEFNWTLDVFSRLLKKDGVIVCAISPSIFYETAELLASCLHCGIEWSEFTFSDPVQCFVGSDGLEAFMFVLQKKS